MSFLAFLPLALSLGICLVPVWLLRRQQYRRAQDYFVSSQYTPHRVTRNASIAHALRMASFGPFFAFGASGDFLPAIVGSACFGLGLYLVYILRRPILEFLGSALSRDQSITVHEFIARRHGNDPRVRLLAASLTIFALVAVVVGEAFAVAAFLKATLSVSATSIHLFMFGALLLMALYAVVSGHSGTMHSAQLQLGMLYLSLFGSTALLIYLHVSALTPMPPHGTLAVAFVAACCALMLYYRRSKYVDTNPIDLGGKSFGAKLLRKFERMLNPCISVFAVLVIVVALMEFYSAGLPAIARNSAAALQAGTSISSMALIALFLLPLFHPMVDVTNWQSMAALEKDRDAYRSESRRWLAALRGIFSVYAVESPLLWLFMCMFGAIAVISMETPSGADMMQAFIRQLAAGQNPVAGAAFSLLLVSVSALALSAMSSAFSASLCTIRYDILPAFWPDLASGKAPAAAEATATRRTLVAAAGLFVMIVMAFYLADAFLRINFASSTFLALIFALCCPQLAFAPLILGPIIGRTSGGFETVSPGWALAILGFGAASSAGAVTIYLTTGTEPWLWAAVPACLASSFLLFTVARLWPGQRAAAA